MEVAPRARFTPRAIAVVFALLVLLAAALAYVPARNAYYLAWHAEQVTGAAHLHPALRWIELPELAAHYDQLQAALDGVNFQQHRLADDSRELAAAAQSVAAALTRHDPQTLGRAVRVVDSRLAALEDTQRKLEADVNDVAHGHVAITAAWEQRWPVGPLGADSALEVRATRPPPDTDLLAAAQAELDAAQTELEVVAARQLEVAELHTGSELTAARFAELELPAGRYSTQRVESAVARLKLLGHAHAALERAETLLAGITAGDASP